MKTRVHFSDHLYLLLFTAFVSFACAIEDKAGYRYPNILIAVADDATYKHFGAYGTGWIDTPNFDRVANEGILFLNAYTPNAKCAPSRASILTGRNSWQLEEACNNGGYFPEKYKTYPEVLVEYGYHVGYTGKGWAPGDPGVVDGQPRHLLGASYQEEYTTPPTTEISNNDYAANFTNFLDGKPEETPFAFWYGGREPHRSYVFRSGIEVGGKSVGQIDHVPEFLPDNDTVRTDLLDYAFEIEYFDRQLGKMLDELEQRGELYNTLVVVTADNGMPFPRVKGQAYAFSNHMPVAIMWPAGILNPGRTVKDFVSFIDFAPTFLEVAGISQTESGMQPITGNSLTSIFYTEESGQINPERDHVLIGKERHDVGRPEDKGYPIRGIVTENYVYLHNFKTKRWPAGNPETGYLNTDGSPTKSWILDHKTDPDNRQYWQWAFGKRVTEELYNSRKDPANIHNLSTRQENTGYQHVLHTLKKRLFQELKDQGDPRMFGNGQVFDEYSHANKRRCGFYEKYMNGELEKSDAGWVNPTDFEDPLE